VLGACCVDGAGADGAVTVEDGAAGAAPTCDDGGVVVTPEVVFVTPSTVVVVDPALPVLPEAWRRITTCRWPGAVLPEVAMTPPTMPPRTQAPPSAVSPSLRGFCIRQFVENPTWTAFGPSVQRDNIPCGPGTPLIRLV
jgi:hypothetical protein